MIVWASVLGLIGCASGPSVVPVTPEATADGSLGPGDVFDVRVYGEEELSGSYQVSGSGTIDYPLVGRIEVAGLEPVEVADRISASLKQGEYLRSPQVSVFVREYNSKKVNIMGAVAKPGTYPVRDGMTVVEAISGAGGLTSIAAGNDVVVTRRVDGQVVRFKVAVSDAASGRVQDVAIQAGDTIFVPERVF